ncbi:hypothetical protein ACWIGI_10750 [Nocardia sp. NPDC055321]
MPADDTDQRLWQVREMRLALAAGALLIAGAFRFPPRRGLRGDALHNPKDDLPAIFRIRGIPAVPH